MKKLFFLPVVFVFCLLRLNAQNSASDMHASGHVMLNAGDLKWTDAPPALPKGAKVAVLSGDPAKPGPFTLRASFPENYKIAPHWHPTYENVVVLEGTLYMGSGEMLDESKAMALNAGGYTGIPAKSAHFAFTKEKTIIQINSEGPFEINYFNPSDDPRQKK